LVRKAMLKKLSVQEKNRKIQIVLRIVKNKGILKK